MKRLLSLAVLLLIFAPTALAQSDEYVRWEFFGGYSALRFDNLGDDTDNAVVNEVLGEKNTLRGFNLAVTGNFHKYFGAKFDYSLHLREDNFSRPRRKRHRRHDRTEFPGRYSNQEQFERWTNFQALWTCSVRRGYSEDRP